MAEKPTNQEIEQARNVLKKAGYAVASLWSIAEVQHKYDVDDKTALNTMNNVLENEAVMEQIWIAIDVIAEMDKLPKKK